MAKKQELDLADILADELNKQSKDQKVAFFLDGDEAPTNVDGWGTIITPKGTFQALRLRHDIAEID